MPFASSLSKPLVRCLAAGRGKRLVWRTSVLFGVLFVLVGGWAPAASAQHEVTGEVTDAEDGSALPGVNIVVQGTQVGASTDSDGEYALEAPAPDDTLRVTFIGYETQDLPIDGRSEINVQMQPAVTAMEEVVVQVGYGQQSVKTTTGSISQVSGADLDVSPTTNLTNTLQGTVPGIIGVSRGGKPGDDGANLLIRGASTLNNNSPLVVIDGVPGRQGGLARLDPSNIASLSVLKDASAAIYGSRAANGVILVETKRGQAGETRINANVEQSMSQPTIYPDMADSPTYLQMLNELDLYRDDPPRYSQEQIDAYRGDLSGSWELFDTDWYDEGFRDFSNQTSANASISGGSEALQYRIALNGSTEDGILNRSSTRYNQFGFRSNLNGDVTDNFEVALNLHGRLEDRNYPPVNYRKMFSYMQQLRPTDAAFWPNGKPVAGYEDGLNPGITASDITGYDDSKTYYFQSNLTLNFDVPGIEGWSLEGTAAYDREFMDRKRWQQPWTLYAKGEEVDEAGDPVLVPVSSGFTEPRLREWDEDDGEVLLRATSRYEKSLGSHNGRLLLGTEWQRSQGTTLEAFRRYYPTNQIQELFAGGTNQQDLTGNSEHSARLNFFGRVNYNYQEKYLLELVARYDGSYIFPEGNRFGFFPAVSAGWRLAQEGWFRDFTGGAFDRLKLRASYGQLGNDQVEPYQFMRTFGIDAPLSYGDGLGTSLSQLRVPNPNITWEVSTKFDLGLQGAVLGNRLSFDLTYFHQFRDDILWFRSEAIPQTAGFSLPRENIGQVRSQGFEGQVGFTQNITSNVTLRAGANLTYAKNEIEYFAEPAGQIPWQRNTGRPMDTELYYVADGILNDQDEIDSTPTWAGARPGDIRFVDINDDGQINSDDRRRIEENDRPDLIGGFHLGATAGPFDATFQFQGAARVHRNLRSSAVGERGNYFQVHAENRWSPETPNGSWPRAYNREEPYWINNQNTFFLQDAKYLRLKAARLGYTLPSGLSGAVGAQQLMVYLSGQNLFTLTSMDILDPEMDSVNDYPPNRTYTLGISMGF